jgi:diadenosine tetraphosphate (Ap4A) HIT family hydrolase
LTDLSPDALSAFWRQAHEIGQRLMARLGAHRVNFEVWGNQTPWLHVHITPRFQSEGEQAVILPPRQAYAWAPETAPQVPGPWTDGLTKVESRAATERALAAHLL